MKNVSENVQLMRPLKKQLKHTQSGQIIFNETLLGSSDFSIAKIQTTTLA